MSMQEIFKTYVAQRTVSLQSGHLLHIYMCSSLWLQVNDTAHILYMCSKINIIKFAMCQWYCTFFQCVGMIDMMICNNESCWPYYCYLLSFQKQTIYPSVSKYIIFDELIWRINEYAVSWKYSKRNLAPIIVEYAQTSSGLWTINLDRTTF